MNALYIPWEHIADVIGYDKLGPIINVTGTLLPPLLIGGQWSFLFITYYLEEMETVAALNRRIRGPPLAERSENCLVLSGIIFYQPVVPILPQEQTQSSSPKSEDINDTRRHSAKTDLCGQSLWNRLVWCVVAWTGMDIENLLILDMARAVVNVWLK